MKEILVGLKLRNLYVKELSNENSWSVRALE